MYPYNSNGKQARSTVGYIMLLKKDMASQAHDGQDSATGMIIHPDSLHINEKEKIRFYRARRILRVEPFVHVSEGFTRANLKAPSKKIVATMSTDDRKKLKMQTEKVMKSKWFSGCFEAILMQ